MRNETTILQQILAFAQADPRIRAVSMNGSRVNPNAPRDSFQDYDVVYHVTDPSAYLKDQSWIAAFGELTILQQNDFNEHGFAGHIFLMLFTDGVRIDLCFVHHRCLSFLGEDSLTTVLLDKDGHIPPLPPASDSGYHTRKPDPIVFAEAINDTFWCSNNIAKGIRRGELAYVKYMFDNVIRPHILHLLEWYAALHHDWGITTGAYGKWLQKYLPPQIWHEYTQTYSGAEYPDIWESLFTALRLTRTLGLELAERLGYSYPLEDDRRVIAYLERVRALPPGAGLA